MYSSRDSRGLSHPSPYASREFPSFDPYVGAAASLLSPYTGSIRSARPHPSVTYPGQPVPADDARQSIAAGRPLRVVHVGQCMLRAGIEQWLRGMIRFSDPNRLRFVRCVVTSEDVDLDVAAEMGIPVEVGGQESVRRAAEECDVLLCSGPVQIAEWLADGPRPLCVFVAHGDGLWTRNILDACAPIVDHVVAVSHRVQQMVCNGFPSTVILNGIDTSSFAASRPPAAVRQSLGFGARDFVLGYVGRFSEEKNPQAVIRAVAQLPPHCKALLVGWGWLRYQLLDLANELIPGRFALVTARGDVGDYYRAMDAFCLPSDFEGFGLVVLEAMFSGVPVIARPVGCVPEFVQDRINGVVVDGRPESFAEVVRLLQEHPAWARSVGEEGRRCAERVGHAGPMCRQYESLLARLCCERHARTEASP